MGHHSVRVRQGDHGERVHLSNRLALSSLGESRPVTVRQSLLQQQMEIKNFLFLLHSLIYYFCLFV